MEQLFTPSTQETPPPSPTPTSPSGRQILMQPLIIGGRIENVSLNIAIRTTDPSATEGKNGDFAFNSTNKKLWLKVAGTWRFSTFT